MRADERPETVEEFLDYIERYADSIYIRVERKGRWTNSALSKASGRDAIMHIAQWTKRGQLPVRVLSDEEIAARRKQVHS